MLSRGKPIMSVHYLETVGEPVRKGLHFSRGLTFLQTSRADIALRESEGAGLPILLIASAAGFRRDFAALFEGPLADEHRLLAVDLPGQGDSGEAHDPETAYSLDGYADALLEIVERMGVDRAFVVDASPDGAVGRELMSVFPGMIGLAVVGDRDPNDTDDFLRRDRAPPIFELPDFTAARLLPILKRMERRDVALSLSPLLWYGG